MRLLLALTCAAVMATPAYADGTATPIDGLDPSAFNVGEGERPLGERTSEWTAEMEAASERAGDVGSTVTDGLDLATSLRDMFSALSDLDQELDSRQTTDDGAGPAVPSSCVASGATACQQCFARAYGEVNFTRSTLERLRTIHRRTIGFIERAEGFGDSVSGVHGVSGLSWQYAKADVEKERASFNRTSRAKYDALLGNMRRSLDMVAECERQHFSNPDWYSRYGFMYYNFIRESYAIAD